MSPDAFWRMTLPEFFAACDGYMESKGVKRGSTDAPTREECDELFAMAEGKR